MSEPTKLPWKYQEESDAYTHIVRGPNGEFVCSGPQDSSGGTEQDMRRVVMAVNYHQRLVDALRHTNVAFNAARLMILVMNKEGRDSAEELVEENRALLAEIDKEAANG